MQKTSIVNTANATQYLGSLCQHFQRRASVVRNGDTGQITLPFGRCTLTAGPEGLTMTATAENASDLDRTMELITNHLDRFAFRENPDITWTPSSAVSSRA